MVAHACNPSTFGSWSGRIIWGQVFMTSLANLVKPVSTKKIQKVSWASWQAPVIVATQEAEVGELFEPRRQKLHWAEIVPLYSSLGYMSKTLAQKQANKQKLNA